MVTFLFPLSVVAGIAGGFLLFFTTDATTAIGLICLGGLLSLWALVVQSTQTHDFMLERARRDAPR